LDRVLIQLQAAQNYHKSTQQTKIMLERLTTLGFAYRCSFSEYY
jgi:hypothetical protein